MKQVFHLPTPGVLAGSAAAALLVNALVLALMAASFEIQAAPRAPGMVADLGVLPPIEVRADRCLAWSRPAARPKG